MNGKPKYIVFILVGIGVTAFLGPVILSSQLYERSIEGIPLSYVYITVIWLLFILAIYMVSNQFNENHDSN